MDFETILFVLDLIAVGGYFKKVETQGLTFPEFQTPLSHLICSSLGAKPLSFSDLCSRSKPGSRQVWQGASHLLPSKANRESERGGSWHLGGLPAQCTPCARRGSQHGSLFKESLALLSLSYSLLLPCLLHCFQPRLLSLSTVPIVSQAASRLIEDHESTETFCRLCIIVERIWSMMMKNGLKAAICSFWSVNYWPTVLKVEIISR